MNKRKGAPRTSKYGGRQRRVSKNGNTYYSYYKPIYEKVKTPYAETGTALRRLALFAKKYKKNRLKGIKLRGLALLVYMSMRSYPMSRISEVFGFSRAYAHRMVKHVRWLNEVHGMFQEPYFGGDASVKYNRARGVSKQTA